MLSKLKLVNLEQFAKASLYALDNIPSTFERFEQLVKAFEPIEAQYSNAIFCKAEQLLLKAASSIFVREPNVTSDN